MTYQGDAAPPPPPPPPHGDSPRTESRADDGAKDRNGLPPGNYDIFIVPPSSSGHGFLYLPSLATNRSSFLLGVGTTVVVFLIGRAAVPIFTAWLKRVLMQSGGSGLLLLIVALGIAVWACGNGGAQRRDGDADGSEEGNSKNWDGAGSWNERERQKRSQQEQQRQRQPHGPGPEPEQSSRDGKSRRQDDAPPHQSPPRDSARSGPKDAPAGQSPRKDNNAEAPKPAAGASQGARASASSAWEQAREDMRRREADRKRAQEEAAAKDAAERKKMEAEREARQKAERAKWEQARAREKEAREREARERLAKARAEKDAQASNDEEAKARLRLQLEREARDKVLREARERLEHDKAKAQASSPQKSPGAWPRYEKPTARSTADDDEYSFRPYDTPPKPPNHRASAFQQQRGTSVSGSTTTYMTGDSSSTFSTFSRASTAASSAAEAALPPWTPRDASRVQIYGVYIFPDKSSIFGMGSPITALAARPDGHLSGNLLVLRIETEGFFIDECVNSAPPSVASGASSRSTGSYGRALREWDVKSWGLRSVEEGSGPVSACSPSVANALGPSTHIPGGDRLHVLRLTLKGDAGPAAAMSAAPGGTTASSAAGKKVIYLVPGSEAWKIKLGIARLRQGKLVKGVSWGTASESEVRNIVGRL